PPSSPRAPAREEPGASPCWRPISTTRRNHSSASSTMRSSPARGPIRSPRRPTPRPGSARSSTATARPWPSSPPPATTSTEPDGPTAGTPPIGDRRIIVTIDQRIRALISETQERVSELHAQLPFWGLVVWTAGNVSERVVVDPSGTPGPDDLLV